jgi:hypothetical protein
MLNTNEKLSVKVKKKKDNESKQEASIDSTYSKK